MPIDTGFLRWSGVAKLNEVPSGKGEGRLRQPGEKGILSEYVDFERGGVLNGVLSKLKIGDTFYWGWTARYAKYQEMNSGFLISALENFRTHLDNAIRRYKNDEL
jgi:hypothetical protein